MKVVLLKRAQKHSLTPPNPNPYLALGFSSIWLVLSCILENKLININKGGSEFCEPFQQIVQPKEGVVGKPDLLVRSTGDLGLAICAS